MAPPSPSVVGSISSLFHEIGFRFRTPVVAPPLVEIDGGPVHSRIGDLWQAEEAALAFDEGRLRSMDGETSESDESDDESEDNLKAETKDDDDDDDDESVESSGSETSASSNDNDVAVVFRNKSSVPLLLCWVSETGEPHHFYRLEPCSPTATTTHTEQDESFELLDTDHLEHTHPGHAFCLGYVENEQEIPRIQKKKSFFRRGNGKNKKRDDKEGSHPKKSCVVVGGYRPFGSAVSSSSSSGSSPSSSSSSMLSRRMHLVTISHRNALLEEANLRRSREKASCFSQSAWCLPRKRRRPIYEEDSDSEDDEADGNSQSQPKPLELKGWILSSRLVRTKSEAYDTTTKVYEQATLGGWPCQLEPNWNNGDKTSAKKLERDIRAASKLLPPHARVYLQKHCKIWVNRSISWGPSGCPIKGHGCCYHPSKGWLIKNGLSGEKHMCVEIHDAPCYRKDCDLWGPGGVMLHELSHAYHHGMLPNGYENEEIQQCYEQAMEEGLYDSVKYHSNCNNGKRTTSTARAYACSNAMEYFAELSAAFLGGLNENEEYNKWYPFNRKQLRSHDPRAYSLLSRLWKVDANGAGRATSK